MPRFEITSPDGRRFEITAPEGATQEQALAYAQGQFKDDAPASPQQQRQPDEADRMAGSPVTRFALGAASPFLGAFQLGANVGDAVTGATGGTPSVGAAVNEHLQRLDQMKRRGMTQAAELQNLQEGRAALEKLPGYEAAIADIDRKIAEIQAAGASADPETAGLDVAGAAGTVLSPAALAAMRIVPAATVLGRSGQGAGIGAAFGASSPVTDTDDYWTAKGAQTAAGAAIGGVIPPAIDLTRAAASGMRRVVDPLLPGGAQRGASRLLTEAAGAKRPQIEAELAANRSFVPGSQPTAAEAAAPAGSAEFAGLQRVVQQRQPTAYADIAKGQETARAAAIGGIAKDKAALTAAETARTTQGRELYAKAFEQATKADGELLALSENPYFKDAVPHALKLAQSEGITAKGNLTRFLHYVKLGLDKELAKSGDTALSAAEKNAVQQVKKQLIEWMDRKNPAYDAARQAFAEASKPINRMAVGQELEKSLSKSIGEGERSTVFANAVRDAPRTIKRATGQPRFDELDQVLDRGEYETVKNVLADLSRKAEQERLGRLGAARASEITQSPGLPATGPLNQMYMIFKTALNRVSKGVNERVLDELADALQVPQKTLKLLQMAPSADRAKVIDAIIQRKLGRGAIIGGTAMAAEGAQQ